MNVDRFSIWSYVLLSCFLLSCQSDPTTQIAKQVEEWSNRTIVFPEGAVFTRLVKDTVEVPLSDKPYKVLVYVDSVGCTSCKLQLGKWKEWMAEVDSVAPGAVEFLFYLLRLDGFDLPMCNTVRPLYLSVTGETN